MCKWTNWAWKGSTSRICTLGNACGITLWGITLWDNITFSGKPAGLRASLQDLCTAAWALGINRRNKRFLCRYMTVITAGVCYRLPNPRETPLNYLWKLMESRNAPDDWKKKRSPQSLRMQSRELNADQPPLVHGKVIEQIIRYPISGIWRTR